MLLIYLSILASLWDSIHGSYFRDCPPMMLPRNGVHFECTNGQNIGSFCWLDCDEPRGYEPVKNQFSRCSEDQVWTHIGMKCQDVEAPQIQNCPTQTVVKWKDPTSEQTYVTWEKPLTVTDNSGERIEVKAIGVQAAGNGGMFPEGVTLVRFTAQDRTKNSAPMCTFLVEIKSTGT